MCWNFLREKKGRRVLKELIRYVTAGAQLRVTVVQHWHDKSVNDSLEIFRRQIWINFDRQPLLKETIHIPQSSPVSVVKVASTTLRGCFYFRLGLQPCSEWESTTKLKPTAHGCATDGTIHIGRTISTTAEKLNWVSPSLWLEMISRSKINHWQQSLLL